MLDPTVPERIRSIFLHDEARVTIEGAARLLGRLESEIAAAIRDGEIETTSACGGTVIDIRELAEQAVHVWPVGAIEEALGREVRLVRGQTFDTLIDQFAPRTFSLDGDTSSRRRESLSLCGETSGAAMRTWGRVRELSGSRCPASCRFCPSSCRGCPAARRNRPAL